MAGGGFTVPGGTPGRHGDAGAFAAAVGTLYVDEHGTDFITADAEDYRAIGRCAQNTPGISDNAAGGNFAEYQGALRNRGGKHDALIDGDADGYRRGFTCRSSNFLHVGSAGACG
jgi:hypothetical protein